jgi:hypothetical protein
MDKIENLATTSRGNLTEEEVDRLFEKRSKVEKEIEESGKKHVENWLKQQWRERTWRKRDFPTGPLAEYKRSLEGRKYDRAGARFEAIQIQSRLQERWKKEYWEVIKEGVLEGAIKIHETAQGFDIDTPVDQVEQYLRQNPKSKNWFTVSDCLKDGSLLLGTSHEIWRDTIRVIRDDLIEEFEASSPSDLMLVDLLTSNYFRIMNATRTEMETLWYAHDFSMEMFEVVHQGLQEYVHECQNQLLRVLGTLRAKRREAFGSGLTYETYSRTRVNLQNWGLLLLLALAEITEQREQQIGINEIKGVMAKHLKGLNSDDIPNSAIGYVLKDYGFKEKIHLNSGNHYDIPRKQVLALLNEHLKA